MELPCGADGLNHADFKELAGARRRTAGRGEPSAGGAHPSVVWRVGRADCMRALGLRRHGEALPAPPLCFPSVKYGRDC